MHLHPKNVFETLFENFLPGTLKGQKGRGPRNDALATQSHLPLGDGEHGLSSHLKLKKYISSPVTLFELGKQIGLG